MILKDCKLVWIKGEHGYKQGIKRGNYRHMEGRSFYNGYGGVHMNIDRELKIRGINEATGQIEEINVASYFLELLGRKKMTDILFSNIEKTLPTQLEFSDGEMTDESKNNITRLCTPK